MHWVKVLDKYPKYYAPDNFKAGGFCECVKIGEDIPIAMDSLVYPYLEGADIWVGPEFGCVHHKTKPE